MKNTDKYITLEPDEEELKQEILNAQQQGKTEFVLTKTWLSNIFLTHNQREPYSVAAFSQFLKIHCPGWRISGPSINYDNGERLIKFISSRHASE